MPTLSQIKIFYCKFPLQIRYNLSYGALNFFNTIILEIKDSEGNIGYGEATFLEGYSPEKPDESYDTCLKISENILKLPSADAISKLQEWRKTNPFLTSAIKTAIEGLDKKYSNKEVKIPIIGLINEDDEQVIKTNVEDFISNGYTAVKTKIGADSLDNDLKKIRLIEKYSKGDLKLRVDANQALENIKIEDVVDYFSSFNIQYLEQPFLENNFEKHLELNKAAPFSIMLDESIWDFDDIDKVHKQGISDYIKLKLQKCFGLSHFRDMVDYLKEKGFKIIIGNGVQTDLNCILESEIFDSCSLTKAAENIGFQKLNSQVTKNFIEAEDGHIITKLEPIELNLEIIEANIVLSKTIK
jgi:L-alanine-DL-glutamate epimerase-like enolase superfamily enzyme